jgi:hypothetical protein
VRKNLQEDTNHTLNAANPCQVTFISDEGTGRGTSLHFNERGMLVSCERPLKLNTKVRMTLLFPGFRNPLEMNGEVVWTNIYGPNEALSPRAMGVKFVNLERDTERLLAELAAQYDVLSSAYSCFYT